MKTIARRTRSQFLAQTENNHVHDLALSTNFHVLVRAHCTDLHVHDVLDYTSFHCVVHAHDGCAHEYDGVSPHTHDVYGDDALGGTLQVQYCEHADGDDAHCGNVLLDEQLFPHIHPLDSTPDLDNMVYIFDDNFSYYSISFIFGLLFTTLEVLLISYYIVIIR